MAPASRMVDFFSWYGQEARDLTFVECCLTIVKVENPIHEEAISKFQLVDGIEPAIKLAMPGCVYA